MDMKKTWAMEAPSFTPAPVHGRYVAGLWKDSPSAPTPPDPYATADAQKKANIEAARATTEMSRYDQITPFGSSTWSKAPGTFDEAGYNKAMADYNARKGQTAAGGAYAGGSFGGVVPWTYSPDGSVYTGNPLLPGPSYTPFTFGDGFSISTGQGATDAPPSREQFMSGGNDHWINTQTLDPKVQAMLDQFYSKAQTPVDNLDFSSLGAMPQASDATRKAVEDAYFNQMRSRLDPRFSDEESSLRSRLANQGITEGSEAYNKELELFGRTKNDAYTSAMNSAVGNSTSEMAKQFGMQMDGRRQGATEISAAHNSQLSDRASLLNELMAIRNGTQVAAPGGGGAAGSVAAAPVAQSIYNAYQGQLGNYNAEVASANAGNSTLGSLAGLAGGALLGMPGLGGALGGLLGKLF